MLTPDCRRTTHVLVPVDDRGIVGRRRWAHCRDKMHGMLEALARAAAYAHGRSLHRAHSLGSQAVPLSPPTTQNQHHHTNTHTHTHMLPRPPLPLPRSVQYLLGLAHGCWVVSYQWVDACLERAGWVAERNYQAQVGGAAVAVHVVTTGAWGWSCGVSRDATCRPAALRAS